MAPQRVVAAYGVTVSCHFFLHAEVAKALRRCCVFSLQPLQGGTSYLCSITLHLWFGRVTANAQMIVEFQNLRL